MSSKDRGPMPEPYTTVNTGYPVGIWMPGKFYTLDYLEWMHAGDPVPYSERHFDADEGTGLADDFRAFDIDPDLKPAFNGWAGDPAKRFEAQAERTCTECGKAFRPRGHKQVTCGNPECRLQRHRAINLAGYYQRKKAS